MIHNATTSCRRVASFNGHTCIIVLTFKGLFDNISIATRLALELEEKVHTAYQPCMGYRDIIELYDHFKPNSLIRLTMTFGDITYEITY